MLILLFRFSLTTRCTQNNLCKIPSEYYRKLPLAAYEETTLRDFNVLAYFAVAASAESFDNRQTSSTYYGPGANRPLDLL